MNSTDSRGLVHAAGFRVQAISYPQRAVSREEAHKVCAPAHWTTVFAEALNANAFGAEGAAKFVRALDTARCGFDHRPIAETASGDHGFGGGVR